MTEDVNAADGRRSITGGTKSAVVPKVGDVLDWKVVQSVVGMFIRFASGGD